MNKQEFLESIRKQIHFVFDRDSIEQELNAHIEDSILNLMEDGYSKEEAEKIAIKQMGDPIEIGKALNEEHHPLLGYLWVASKVALGLLVIPACFWIAVFGYNLFQVATPLVVENSEVIIPLDIEFDVDTHYVTLNDICVNDKGEYMITYRSWTNYFYSRAGWSNSLFAIENKNGDYWENSGSSSHGPLGSIGYKTFEWPENGILNLKTSVNEFISIDLKEYDYEPK